jgi:hypothetical protein
MVVPEGTLHDTQGDDAFCDYHPDCLDGQRGSGVPLAYNRERRTDFANSSFERFTFASHTDGRIGLHVSGWAGRVLEQCNGYDG